MAYTDAQGTNNSIRSNKTYSDLNLNFTKNPATNDVARLTDVEAVKRALERTPPELSADILDQGIIMTGGGSMLRGIDQLIRERTNVPVNIAEDPLLSVVKGTGKVLENVKKYESVLI